MTSWRIRRRSSPCSALISTASRPSMIPSAERLLQAAGRAMYGANAVGRGTFRCFGPGVDAQIRARRALVLDWRRAIELEQFELHYQPIVDARSRRVTGFEALLRWPHPE